MIGTFIAVAALTLKNRVWQRLRRLRQPRYLAGALAGAAYFWFVFFRRAHHGIAAVRVARGVPFNEMAVTAVSVVVLMMMIGAWALPGDTGGLDFTEAEIAFLFTAPLRRRDLLLYKIIRAQPQALVSALFLTVVGWTRGKFVGTWIAVGVLSVYFMLVALGRARLKLMHVNFLARLVIVLAIFAGISVWATTRANQLGHGIADFSGAMRTMPAVLAALRTPVISAVLFIPRLFAGAVIPLNLTMLATSCAGLMVLGVVLFFLASAVNVSFQEASISYSQRRAKRRERIRDDRLGVRIQFRRAPPLFRLGETGTPEVAFIWKNVIALLRTNVGWAILLLAMVFYILGQAFWTRGEPEAVAACGAMLLAMAALFPFLGTQVFANDLRLDLQRAEVLKSYPISGERLVAAEVAAPLAVIAFFEMLFIGLGSALLRFSNSSHWMVRFLTTPQFMVVALLLTLPICTLQLLLRNATPVFFPAWVLRSKDEARGFVAMGQRLIVLVGNVLCLAAALVPPALVFLPSAWIAWRFFANSPIGLAVAAMPAVAVIAGEAWLGTRALGAQFERLDLTSEFDIATT